MSKRKAKLAPKLSGLDKNALITDLPKTKEIFGNIALLCWNCVSEVCRARQRISIKTCKQKFVNKTCPKGKLLAGSEEVIKVLNTPYSRDAYNIIKLPFKVKSFSNSEATVIKPPMEKTIIKADKLEALKRLRMRMNGFNAERQTAAKEFQL